VDGNDVTAQIELRKNSPETEPAELSENDKCFEHVPCRIYADDKTTIPTVTTEVEAKVHALLVVENRQPLPELMNNRNDDEEMDFNREMVVMNENNDTK
jgi:hypothetical protein